MTGQKNALTGGFSLMCRNWRCLTWTYFFNLLFAAIAAVPLAGQASAMLNHSMAAQAIAGRLDVGMLGELSMHMGERPSGIFAVSFVLDMLFVLMLFLFTPAIISMYFGDELVSPGNMFRIGFRFFWRMVRIFLWFALIGGVSVGLLFALRGALLKRLDNIYVERQFFFWSVGTLMVVVLVTVFFRLWFDMAQVVLVERGTYRMGRVESRSAWRSLGAAWRLMRAGFWRLYFSWIVIRILCGVAFLLCLALWRAAPPHSTLLAFVLGQLALFSMLASRFWQRGLEVQWCENYGDAVTPRVAPLTPPNAYSPDPEAEPPADSAEPA